MTRSGFIRFANRSLLAAGFALLASTAGLHAISNDQVPPKPYPQLPRFEDKATKPAPDLTLNISSVTCFDGKVAVNLYLSDQAPGAIAITDPFVTLVKVGGHAATIPSNASPQNPWYNGQQAGTTLITGYGTFLVSAKIDATGLVAETNENNNVAPSAQNSFDNNPNPLYVTCKKPSSDQGSQPSEPQAKPAKKKDKVSRRLISAPSTFPPVPARRRSAIR